MIKVKIDCDNDTGIAQRGTIEVEHLPLVGDVIELDGLDFKVIGRRFSPDFSDSGIHGIKIMLHGEE